MGSQQAPFIGKFGKWPVVAYGIVLVRPPPRVRNVSVWPKAADLRRCGKLPVIWATPAIAPPHFGEQPMAPQRKAVRAMPCRLFEVVQEICAA